MWKQPAAGLHTATWARNPAANGRATETTRTPRPPGLNLAREPPAATGRPSPRIGDPTARRASRAIKTRSTGSPRKP
jgi:hypothetical protein